MDTHQRCKKQWVSRFSRFSYNPILVDRGKFGDRHGSAATHDSEFSCRIVSFYGILDGSVVELRRGERESSSRLSVRTRRLAWISTDNYLPKRKGDFWPSKSGIGFGIEHSGCYPARDHRSPMSS